MYDSQHKLNEPIEQRKIDEISTEPLGLPEGYEWSIVDLSSEKDSLEVYNLLTNHYVEDDGGSFRFDYSI